MKKLASSVITCFVLTLMFPVLLFSQEPIHYMVFEEHVAPSVRSEFMEVQQEAVDMWKKYEMDIPVFCYSNDENSLYWVVPIQNFASIDTMFMKMGKMTEKMKADGNDMNEKFRDLSTMTSSVIMWDQDLSYHPNDEYGQTMDKRYIEWTFLYVRSGHEKELAAAIQKYIDFYSEKEEDYPWDIFRVVMGENMPAVIFMVRAESPAALHAQEKELMENYQSDFGEMWENVSKHLRDSETKTGWFIPKFSMLPEE
jgi:hypothetical protein